MIEADHQVITEHGESLRDVEVQEVKLEVVAVWLFERTERGICARK